MKKVYLIIFVFIILFLIIPLRVNAAPSATITINGPTTAKAGDTITLTLKLVSDYKLPHYGLSEGLSYAIGGVSFNANNVTYIGFGYLGNNYNPNIAETGVNIAGKFIYSVAAGSNNPNELSRVGDLIKITFKINDDVADNTVLTFKVEPSSYTRVRQDKNVDRSLIDESIDYYYGKSYYDINATGGTLNIKVSNPTTVNTNQNTSTSSSTNNTSTSNLSNTSSSSNSNSKNNTTKNNNVEPVVEKSSNNYLRNLIVEKYQLDKAFDKNNFEYTITVLSETNEIDIEAVTEDNKSIIEITGNKDLVEGNNIAQIKVIAEDGEEKVYTLNIIKMREEEANTEEISNEENKESNNSQNKVMLFVISTIAIIAVSSIIIIIVYKKIKKVK